MSAANISVYESDWLRHEFLVLGVLATSFALLYFGLFNHDFTVDGLLYASQVEAGGPLFHPNHLLPNALFSLAWKGAILFGYTGRAIWVMQALNALLGVVAATAIVRALARRTGLARAATLGVLYGLGFAAWTFAEEPEVYVFPACAVAVSLALLWRAPEIGWGRLVALLLLAAFAVLCLQQYVFWYPVLLALLWNSELGSARTTKLVAAALVPVLLCMGAYLLIGAMEGRFDNLSQSLGWFLGYAWDDQKGFGTYRESLPLAARLSGLVVALANLALPYEVVTSKWLFAVGAMGLAVLGALLWGARRSFVQCRFDASCIATWMLLNIFFATWWESRNIEFLLPVWMGGILLAGLSRGGWRLPALAAVLIGGVNVFASFLPQSSWPARYQVAAALARTATLAPADVLITEELNTVRYLAYFHGVRVQFLPGAISAAMHADESVGQARAIVDRSLEQGARVYTTELDEHGRLFALARHIRILGRASFDGGIERDLDSFYAGLNVIPGPVVGVRQVLQAAAQPVVGQQSVQ